MPLMIDASTLVPCLEGITVTRKAAHTALELMVGSEGDASDVYSQIAEQANNELSNKLRELEQMVRKLVDVADRAEDDVKGADE